MTRNDQAELTQVAELVMGTSPRGDTYNTHGQGLALLNGPTEFGATHPSCTLFTTDPKRTAARGDLLFCVRGSTTGRMNWADRPYAIGRGIAAIRGRSPLETRFIRYCLEARLPSLLKRAGGGTFPNLRQDDIATFPIPYPDERAKIATVIASYDELVENNLRRIEILEEIAHAIYREWFVNVRFPGHENVQIIDSQRGSTPVEWEVKPVDEVIELNPQIKVPREGVKPYVPMGSLGEFSMVIGDIEGREKVSGSKFMDGDTLLARITPCLENGKTAFVQFLGPGQTGLGSTEFIVMRSRTLTPEYVYLLARSDDFRENAIKSMSGASGRQRVQQAAVGQFSIAQPPQVVLASFTAAVRPLFEQVNILNNQNRNLRTTRNLLLPRLISGEIDVSDLDIDTSWLAA